ncbi:MAG: PilZ domain-containing protein [Acidobacteria bacterium]|nr:PilZ domain-containing protein [Acidobacteriota bacterium]
MQGLCDSCEESADHLFDLTRLPEFRSVVKRLNYRKVCQICYDDLYDEVKEQETQKDRRTETRYPVNLKISLSGVDRGGNKFSEDAFTKDISLSGARISIKHQVELGSVLNISIPDNDVEATVIIEVMWHDGKSKTAGIKLVETNDSWAKMVSSKANLLNKS